jgi:hypothetical protein
VVGAEGLAVLDGGGATVGDRFNVVGMEAVVAAFDPAAPRLVMEPGAAMLAAATRVLEDLCPLLGREIVFRPSASWAASWTECAPTPVASAVEQDGEEGDGEEGVKHQSSTS